MGFFFFLYYSMDRVFLCLYIYIYIRYIRLPLLENDSDVAYTYRCIGLGVHVRASGFVGTLLINQCDEQGKGIFFIFFFIFKLKLYAAWRDAVQATARVLSNAILSHNTDVLIKPYYLRDQENPYRLCFFFVYGTKQTKIII